jgi:hypothetical protein
MANSTTIITASSTNKWGNKKEDIDPAEYCQECEQSTERGHYSFCPVPK